MKQEIFKHVKAIFTCKACRKKFTKRLIIEGLNDVSVSELTPRIIEYKPTSCKKCSCTSFSCTYSFYHEEKVK